MKACSRSPVWTALFIVAASSFVAECEARTWIDVVNPSVFVASNLDVYRMEFFLEEDPLAFPSSAPTRDPSGSSEPEDNTLVDGGASSSPSAAPTARYDNVAGYGGCPIGEYLYELQMFDSWGDGWDDSVIKITQMAMEEAPEDDGEGAIFTPAVNIFEGGLATGREGYSYLCLEPFKCYTADIDGGLWTEDIKWEIRAVPLGYSREERESMVGLPVAKGLAPNNCQFSIPDEVTGEMECPFICDNKSASSSIAPASASLIAPSTVGSVMPSDAPSFVPSSIPSESPTATLVKDFRNNVLPASDTPSTGPSAPPSTSTHPSALPTGHPTDPPTDTPSTFPSAPPSASAHPSDHPSAFPSAQPSARPSNNPNDNPFDHTTDYTDAHMTNGRMNTTEYTDAPAAVSAGRKIVLPTRPTQQPSLLPSDQPSLNPTDAPFLYTRK
jgi:hypothetical protein